MSGRTLNGKPKAGLGFAQMLAMTLLVLAGLLLLLAGSLARQYDNAQRNARINAENIARLIAEQTARQETVIDLALSGLVDRIRPSDLRPARGSGNALDEALKKAAATLPNVSGVHVVNADGRVVHSSVEPLPEVTISEAPTFRRLRDDPPPGLLILGPVQGRIADGSGKWILTHARRLSFADGRFAGMITLGLDLDLIRRFYKTIDIGPHGFISLRDPEGKLIARHPDPTTLSQPLTPIKASAAIGAGGESGSYRTGTDKSLDGMDRQVVFRKVEGWPLYIFVGLAKDDVLAEWRSDVKVKGATAAVLIVLAMAGLWTMWRNVQRRNAAAARLAESEGRYRLVTDNAEDWVFLIRPDGRWGYSSPSCETITGHRAEEFAADPELLTKIVLPEDRERWAGNLAVPGQELEVRIVRADGAIRWINHRCREVNDEAGPHLCGRIADVTSRRQAEDQLRESLNFRETLLDSIVVPIFFKGRDGRYIGCNQPFASMFGLTVDQIVGHTVHDITPPEKAEIYAATDAELIARSGTQTYETRLTTKAGVFDVIITKGTFRHGDGSVAGLIGTFTDITERKRMEEAREELVADLHAAIAQKNRMVGILAHDLRNPIGAISLSAEMLEISYADQLDERMRRSLGTIRSAVGFVDGLIADVLASAVADAGTVTLHRHPFDLGALVERVVGTNSLVADRKGVSLLVDTQATTIDADEVKIRQVLNNLIVNAIKFSHAGGEIRVVVKTVEAGVTIRVSDQGVGIPADIRATLFEPFGEGRSGTGGEASSGLGLYICSQIVHAHAGTITVTSAPDLGTVFTVVLPSR